MNKGHFSMSKTKTSRTNCHKFVRHSFGCMPVLLFCILGFLSPLVSVHAATLPATAKILPSETIVLLDISDFQQTKMQFEKTYLYKLYQDPAMAAFSEDAKAKLLEKIQKLDDNDVFKTLFNTEVWPQGKVAVALVLKEESRDFNEPQILMITQWGEGIDKIKEAVDEMLQKNIEYGGSQKSSEDYRGVSIQRTIDEISSEINHCFIDDCFIAATNLDIIKFVIAHIKGSSSPALADDTDYATSMKAVGPYHDIDFYVNMKQIIKTAIAGDPTGKTNELITNLGIDNISGLGGSIALARSAGTSGSIKTFLKINGSKRGICKMLEVDSAAIRAPRFLASTAYSTTFFNLDIKKAYDELYKILYTFNPQYASLMHMFDLPDSPTGEPGVEFESDIINHMGSQIVFSQSVNKPFSNTSVPTETLVALAVNNREALEKSLSLIHSKLLSSHDTESRRELLGHTIYLLNFSSLPFLSGGRIPMQVPSGLGAPQRPKPAFTITDTHLIFASEASVERAIRTLTNTDALSIGSAKWFTTAKSAIPSAVGMATLQDNAVSSELFWWMVRESGAASPSPAADPMGFGKLVNFALLPEFDAVRKYFGLSAFYGISKPDGFFFEVKYLDPPAAD